MVESLLGLKQVEIFFQVRKRGNGLRSQRRKRGRWRPTSWSSRGRPGRRSRPSQRSSTSRRTSSGSGSATSGRSRRGWSSRQPGRGREVRGRASEVAPSGRPKTAEEGWATTSAIRTRVTTCNRQRRRHRRYIRRRRRRGSRNRRRRRRSTTTPRRRRGSSRRRPTPTDTETSVDEKIPASPKRRSTSCQTTTAKKWPKWLQPTCLKN